MINTVENLDFRKAMEQYVDGCLLNIPEDVARLFKEYTLLIWDYKLTGRIYDFYNDNIILYLENGITVVGIEGVIAATLAFTATVPDNESWFTDIFAEGNPQDGYSFIQSTRRVGTCLGYSSAGKPTGRSLSEGGRDAIALCECRVQKIDGRWKITEEWLVRSGASVIHVMTPGSAPVVFENNTNIMLPETTPYRGWCKPAGPEEPA